MSNNLIVNPETAGTDRTTALVRRATVVHDQDGNDISTANRFPVSSIISDEEGNPISTANTFPVETFAGPHSDFDLEVGKGKFEGYNPVFVAGFNEDVGSERESIRPLGGRYPFPSTASQWDVVSDSTDDTSTGTGARTVMVMGLDINYAEQLEIVTLNGTTPVTTTLSFLRVNSFSVLTAGSTKVNQGTVDLYVGSDIYSQIIPLNGNAPQLIFTVPLGKTWFTGTLVNTSGRDDEITLGGDVIIPQGAIFSFSTTYIYQNNLFFRNFNKFPFVEKTDFELTVRKTGAAPNGRCAVVQEFLEVDNDNF